MNYRGKRVAITGAGGFLGNALIAQLQELVGPTGEVYPLKGDIRDRRTFENLDHTYDYLFHFAAPSSQVQFKRQTSYAIQTTVNGFMNAATAAKRHGIRFIYPSTGLLSSSQELNEYALCKRLCELYVQGKSMDALGIRIFATYGPGEGHKRDFASVPYLFARDIVNNKQPVIYGDGEQVRDFIYIDDVVNAILVLAEECSDPIVDVGSGDTVSFNEIIHKIRDTVDVITKTPVYIEKPAGYVQETGADPSRMLEFYKPQVTFSQGIRRVVKHLQELQQ